MKLKTFNFEGADFSKLFSISKITMPFLSKQNDYLTVGNSNGAKLKHSKVPSSKISIEGTIINQLSGKTIHETKDAIVLKLNTLKEGKLQLSHLPDRYFNAIFEGTTEYDATDDDLTELEITFSVPDGLAHALEEKTYTTESSKFVVNNDGTYKSYPVLEATMPGDNGVVAFLNDRGNILQFGNPDEADDEAYTESDRVIWDTVMHAPAEQSRGWKTNEYQFSAKWDGRYTLNANGQRRFGVDSGYGYVECSNYGTGTQGFKGITYGRKVSPDSQGHVGAKDFESRHGVWFETTNVKQTGIFLCELRDKDGNQVCSVVFYKTNSTNNNAYIRVNVRGNIKKDVLFQPTAWNFYSKKGREYSIVKTGKTIRFHIGGVANGGFIHSVTLDELENVEVTDVVYYIGVPVASTASPLAFMRLTHSTFRKDNVSKLRDIKNLYGESDILRVDCGSGVVTVNGIEMKGLGSLGNDWDEFYLEPGLNEIECICSSWAQQPNYKLYNREVFL